MVRIVADTSTLYSTRQAREAGFAVSALSVTIAGKNYREFDEISPVGHPQGCQYLISRTGSGAGSCPVPSAVRK